MLKEFITAISMSNHEAQSWFNDCPALGDFARNLQTLRKPVIYPVIATNFIVTIILLLVTWFYNIRGRVFKLFIINTYGLNLIYVIFFTVYAMYPDWFTNMLTYSLMGKWKQFFFLYISNYVELRKRASLLLFPAINALWPTKI